jgi:NhaP-type Na+/H+ or K+/H+ antiporter
VLQPFAERPTLTFLAAVVVVATLAGQGLTLGPLLNALALTLDRQDGPRGGLPPV